MDLNFVKFKLARAALYHYEEPCLSGTRGSGTLFFSGCDLRCPFCQNYEISAGGKGLTVNGNDLIFLARSLVEEGAENINLVTPSIWLDKLIPVLEALKNEVKVPIVWNSNGREDVAKLKKLEGLVDVYLPDFKYSDEQLAREYGAGENYPERARAAISEMRRQQPTDVFDERRMMQKGVIVRHLVLPAAVENTRGVLDQIAAIDKTLYVSLMGQYFPTPAVQAHPVLGRRITQEEYDEATDAFFEAGLTNGFSQELDSATEEYVPDFDLGLLEKRLSGKTNGFSAE